MQKMSLGVIILAGGVGKRFHSPLPKIMHKLCGKEMIYWVIEEVEKMETEKIVVIINPRVKNKIKIKNIKVIPQPNPLGTGDAVLCAEKEFENFKGRVLILCGDTPLIKKESLERLVKIHQKEKNTLTILTAKVKNPKMYGRVVKKKGKVVKIVEDKDANEKIKKINEINTGIYVAEKRELFSALKKITPNNVQKEYYLTDAIEILVKKGEKVGTILTEDENEIQGINTREDFYCVEKILQTKINLYHLRNGVKIEDIENTKIDYNVKIGKDTVIQEGTTLKGNTTIGERCEIGKGSVIVNSVIPDDTKIEDNTYIKDALLG